MQVRSTLLVAASLIIFNCSVTIVCGEENVASIRPISDSVLQQDMEQSVRPLLQKYCFDCHSGDQAEAGVDLTRYSTLEDIRGSSSVWEQVRGLIKIGAMPPPDSDPLPTEDERKIASQWIDDALHYVDCSECYAPAPITVRRLNAVEYDHTIRDLFGVDLQPSRAIGFVTDEVGNGFDNQGEVLTVSPLAIEKFFEAAHYVAEKVIVENVDSLRRQQKNGTSIERAQTFDATFDLAAGKYDISARMEFGFEQDFSIDAQLLIDGEVIENFEVPPKRETFRWTRELTEGEHTFSIHFIDNEKIGGEGGQRRRLRIESVSVRGPEDGKPRFPKEHRSIVIAHPDDGIPAEEAAAKIADAFLPRAFRRPPTQEARDAMVNAITSAVASGKSFEKAVKEGIEVALVSPEFFFRLESNSGKPIDDEKYPREVQQVDAFDLASRLSYFIWSSTPDEELLKVAHDGSLLELAVLEAQVDRMLNDPKTESGLVTQFFGQWLGLRNLKTLQVDQDRFPMYNEKLSSAMLQETTMFCADVLRNGKLIDFLSADYTFVNPRLADLYGVDFEGKKAEEMYLGGRRRGGNRDRSGAYTDEEKFIRVNVDANRKGILTHASILTLTSNPTRTSPVKRGKWVLENIIGDPPPAAPPGVPALEESAAGKEKLSLREQLEIHRANPSCASCHKIMDPIGLGLEAFDAVGRFREKDGELPIDAAGQLADGSEFKGPNELITLLLRDEEKFARHFVNKILTFALGRGLVRQDACTVSTIMDKSRAENFQVKVIIKAVVTSVPFRYRVANPELAANE